MTWNEVVTKVRDRIQRGLGLEDAKLVRMDADAGGLAGLGQGRPVATPPVDVYENEREFLISADVPGASRRGVTVTWDEQSVVTLGVMNEAHTGHAGRASDDLSCDWYRRLELPAYVDGSKGTSTLKNGVLTIRIPKRAVTSRTIPVRAN
jgi:HSP20 family protein